MKVKFVGHRTSSYYRTKKYRSLKRNTKILNTESSDSEFSISSNNASLSDNGENPKKPQSVDRNVFESLRVQDLNKLSEKIENLNPSEHLNEECWSESSTLFNQEGKPSSPTTESQESEQEEAKNCLVKCLRKKLTEWATKNINYVPHTVLNELLIILRSVGHLELPKSAETLLSTKRTEGRITKMESGKLGKFGEYLYCGIKSGLRSRILNSGFDEETIETMVNIDSFPLFNKSDLQMMPILMQILHKDFHCKPFEVALYAGKSKPGSPNIFLDDFVNECADLIENGVTIGEKRYNFNLKAFVCDTPARAYLKCTKGHTGFYACERCEIKGQSVSKSQSNPKSKVRVYPEINYPLRTKESFEKQLQNEHHHPGEASPLLRIPNFDPVRGVLLDSMHLLPEGVMKLIFDKLLSRGKSQYKISWNCRNLLSEKLDALSHSVPSEFQRKSFPLDGIVNWKATQYRYILLYAGVFIFRRVLSREMYKHFLLLFVSSRILFNRELAVERVKEADAYLRRFVTEMSQFYGSTSHVMNIHNLIHVAQDVQYMQGPLSDYSAFDSENRLGKIKQLVRTPRNIVAQIFRRTSEIEASGSESMTHYPLISNLVRSKNTLSNSTISYSPVTVKQCEIGTTSPNNVVQLISGEFFLVNEIYSHIESSDINDFFANGLYITNIKNVFEEPINSKEIGVVKVKHMPSTEEELSRISLKEIKRKCVLMVDGRKKLIVSLLHV